MANDPLEGKVNYSSDYLEIVAKKGEESREAEDPLEKRLIELINRLEQLIINSRED